MAYELRDKEIKHIFKEMNYEETIENVSKAACWMRDKGGEISAYNDKGIDGDGDEKNPIEIPNNIMHEQFCKIYIPEVDTVKKILLKSSTFKWKVDAFEREKILLKLAEDIERNADVISQIEVIARGILSKDTRTKAIPLLAQYFYYYSTYVSAEEVSGIAVGIIPNRNILSNLGLMLAPALAAGRNIVLLVGTELCPVTFFLLELAKNAGIPEELITLIPSDDGKFLPTLTSSSDVAILTILDNLHDRKYLDINCSRIKVLNLASYKTPWLVFECADLDSAASNVLEAAFCYRGMLPWSVDTVLVQENVLEPFLERLKSNVMSATIGRHHGAVADFPYPSVESRRKLSDLVDEAVSQGIEVFPCNNDKHYFPILFIGAKFRTNRVLTPDDHWDLNPLYVIPFRTIDEGVNLANNTRQGLGASVWTENIGLMNEVTRKLKVSNIWVNGHGLMAADLPISPLKDSGKGYFGGKEGLAEYLEFGHKCHEYKPLNGQPKLVESVINAINAAKKAQEGWNKMLKIDRAKLLRGFIRDIRSKDDFRTKSELNFRFESVDSNCNISQLGYILNSTREPLGAVAIEIADEESWDPDIILTALHEGNSVILLNALESVTPICQELIRRLPSGVCSILPYNVGNALTAVKHKELNAYIATDFNSLFAELPIGDLRIFTTRGLNNFTRVTFCKNIWSNVGKSSTCSL